MSSWLLLLMKLGQDEVVIVSGPFRSVAAQAWSAGSNESHSWQPGSVAAEAWSAGSNESEAV